MSAGYLTLSLDDEVVTTLARFAVHKLQPRWPFPFNKIAADSLCVRAQDHEHIEVMATGLPRIVLGPEVDRSGKLDLTVRLGMVDLPAFINGTIKGPLNKQIAHWQQSLAAQGLRSTLAHVKTRTGLLFVTVAVAPQSRS